MESLVIVQFMSTRSTSDTANNTISNGISSSDLVPVAGTRSTTPANIALIRFVLLEQSFGAFMSFLNKSQFALRST
ncbi:MAG: hypothetical protein WB424_16350, partial [Terracidiphilus sp.]